MCYLCGTIKPTKNLNIMSAIQKFSGNPASFNELSQMATQLAKSGYFPLATTPEQAVAKALLGLELGLGMASAMKEIHIIEGKTVISANLYARFVKSSSKYDYKVLRYDAEEVSLQITDKQGNVLGTVTKNFKVLKERGITNAWNRDKKVFELKTVWKNYPENMLFARAISDAVRTFCPDVFTSVVYTPDEFNVPINANGDIDHEAKQVYVNYETVPSSEIIEAEKEKQATPEQPLGDKIAVLFPFFERYSVTKEQVLQVAGKNLEELTEADYETLKLMLVELRDNKNSPTNAEDCITKYTAVFQFAVETETTDEDGINE